jgi:hypothetical protein
MIVILVLAVLAAVAAPNLQEMVIRNRLDSAANEFVTTLNSVRSDPPRWPCGSPARRRFGVTGVDQRLGSLRRLAGQRRQLQQSA